LCLDELSNVSLGMRAEVPQTGAEHSFRHRLSRSRPA
jgi:hypothetical protein